jgi:hypothetical protein
MNRTILANLYRFAGAAALALSTLVAIKPHSGQMW